LKQGSEAEIITDGKRDLHSGLHVTWVGMFVNIVLIVLKLWAGVAGRSQALVADGVHSISDLFSDVVVILGLCWGRKEADENHHYGHARIETSASLVVGLVLAVVAFWIGYNAVSGMIAGDAGAPKLVTIIAAAVSIILKEALYWYTVRVGKRIRSSVLVANAWHHRTDALSSVAVLLGAGAAYLNPRWWYADLIAAALVALFVVRVAYELVMSAFREMVDTAPAAAVVQRISILAGKVDGVRDVHNIRARHLGPNVIVELHLVVDPQITVFRGHQIADQVEKCIIAEMEEVTHVTTHIEPDPQT
jgi:cation diffusion facilitator family transporter